MSTWKIVDHSFQHSSTDTWNDYSYQWDDAGIWNVTAFTVTSNTKAATEIIWTATANTKAATESIWTVITNTKSASSTET